MIIDVHTHAFPDFLAEKALAQLSSKTGDYRPFVGGSLNELITSIEEAGIDRAFLANIATRPSQTRSIMEWVGSIKSEKIIPLGSFHPKSETWEEDVNTIVSCGFPGVKFHPLYQDFVVDDEDIFGVYEKLAEKKLFVLFHAGFDIAFPGDTSASSERIARIQREFKNLRIIAAHMGGWHEWDNVVKCIAGTDTYIDTSFIHEVSEKALSKILSSHDRSRFLFASDSPWTSQKNSLVEIDRLSVDDDFKDKILGLNAARLLEGTRFSV